MTSRRLSALAILPARGGSKRLPRKNIHRQLDLMVRDAAITSVEGAYSLTATGLRALQALDLAEGRIELGGVGAVAAEAATSATKATTATAAAWASRSAAETATITAASRP